MVSGLTTLENCRWEVRCNSCQLSESGPENVGACGVVVGVLNVVTFNLPLDPSSRALFLGVASDSGGETGTCTFCGI